MGSWAYYLDAESKKEAVQMCLRCLDEYPSAEYFCALARVNLRNILKDEYQELSDWSKEKDLMVVQFYSVPVILNEVKECVAGYTTIAQSIPLGLPYPDDATNSNDQMIDKSPIELYIILGILIIIVVCVIIFLIKMKSQKAK